MTKKRVTRDVWLERVRAWKASGLQSAVFVKGKGFSANALRWWSWKLGSEGEDLGKPVRVPKPKSPIEFVELVAPAPDTSGLVVRVGRAEVEIGRDFDAHTLARLLEVLEAHA